MKGGLDIMEFSEEVKIARAMLGISQEKLAKGLDLSFSTINRWENGHSKPNKLTKKAFRDYCVSNGIQIDNHIVEEKGIINV